MCSQRKQLEVSKFILKELMERLINLKVFLKIKVRTFMRKNVVFSYHTNFPVGIKKLHLDQTKTKNHEIFFYKRLD